jgi:hypothetical protein
MEKIIKSNKEYCLKYFTIFGERCSGTTFLENSILKNFDLEVTWKYGWKHMWNSPDFDPPFGYNSDDGETLFIGIVRNPVNWIDSFFIKPYHVPENKMSSIENFLDDTDFTSFNDENINIEKYNSIFELRKVKNDMLKNTIPSLVKNYILIKYEDLDSNFDKVISEISSTFNICLKEESIFRPLGYKGFDDPEVFELFFPRKIQLSPEIYEKIITKVDKEQEISLGYEDIFK